ncbi:MAG: deoxyribonuclease IV [Candidatus Omnitrophica bacterium]|nr:deoxyribonuclease IV [Candidatus Omnitrophota bacterium]
MLLGVHVSISGGIINGLEQAKRLRCTALQMFSHSPRTWRGAAIDDREIERFIALRRQYGIESLVLHVPYLINLAAPDNTLWRRSIESFTEDIRVADRLKADYFVTHIGGHKTKTISWGIKRFSRALNTILSRKTTRCTILLENTAGSGSGLGGSFEHIAEIFGRVKKRKSLGVCLDTAHAFQAGYDISTRGRTGGFVRLLEDTIGVDRVKVVHLNDSKTRLASHHDRHWHIGKGCIGSEGLSAIINHPLLRGKVFILETPKMEEGEDRRNLKKVGRLRR